MKRDTLFRIYSAVAENKMKTRQELSEMTETPSATLCRAIKELAHAELIKEHYIAHKSRFTDMGVFFAVLDMRSYSVSFFDESLKIVETLKYEPNPTFAAHDNLRGFVSASEQVLPKKKVISVCLIPSEEFNTFCEDVIYDYISVVRGREPSELALKMREKYFSVKLELYQKKTCKN